jgi:hypothetical protein
VPSKPRHFEGVWGMPPAAGGKVKWFAVAPPVLLETRTCPNTPLFSNVKVL